MKFQVKIKGKLKGVLWKQIEATYIFTFCRENVMHRWSPRHFSFSPVSEQSTVNLDLFFLVFFIEFNLIFTFGLHYANELLFF